VRPGADDEDIYDNVQQCAFPFVVMGGMEVT
jgi:hypothetical protein